MKNKSLNSWRAVPLILLAILVASCIPAVNDNPKLVALRVAVLDSVNGSTIGACEITAIGKDGSVSTFPAVATPANIQLNPDLAPYTVRATKSGSAVSSLQEVDPRTQTAITLYCHAVAQITRSASPVTILSVEKSANADGSGALPLGTGLDTVATPYLIVSATAASGIEATAWSGFGIKVDLDNMPTTFNGITPTTLLETSVPVADGFRTTALFDFSNFSIAAGPHSLDVVAYDIDNNRAEVVKSLNQATDTAGVDITACAFDSLKADLRVFGLSRDYFSKPGTSLNAMTQYDGFSTSYRGAITFHFLDASGFDQAILGYDVERSGDGINFARIGGINYGSPSTGDTQKTLGLHTYYEVNPDLVQGKVYTYRVTAFTDSTHRLVSGTTSAMILPPFTASLVGPATKQSLAFDTTAGSGPDFTFSISNPSLWDAANADGFYFSLLIRDRSGLPQYFGKYRYSFISNSFQFNYGGSWYRFENMFGTAAGNGYTLSDLNSDYMSYSSGSITIKGFIPFLAETNAWNYSPFPAIKGQDYEWNIFGDYSSGSGGMGSSAAMSPCYFRKAGGSSATTSGTIDGTVDGIAKSYADTPAAGNDTRNGWFEFSVQ